MNGHLVLDMKKTKTSATRQYRAAARDNSRSLARMKLSSHNRWPARQGGVALVVALLLLVVITLVGLAGVRSTIMQQKMASNLFDRQIAFQSTEAALRVAQSLIQANPQAAFVRDCDHEKSTACLADPFDDPNTPAAAVQTVATGTGATQFTAGSNATGQPQFVVENMGKFQDPAAKGLNQTANALQNYGGTASGLHTYFRITARSGNPTTVGARSVVTLQTMVKQ